ncbi:MAG TPA: TonB C-terminal domain-containing protein [Chroococcales cyanobacterium]
MIARDSRRIEKSCIALLLAMLVSPQAGSAAKTKSARQGNAPRSSPRASGVNRSAQTPQVAAYLASTRSKMLNNWTIPDGKNRVVITASLGGDGGVQDSSLSSTPKNAAAEQAANDAFSRAQPFSPLPAGIATPAKLVVTFESSADPHGDSSSNLYTQLFPASRVKPAAPAPVENGSAPASNSGDGSTTK